MAVQTITVDTGGLANATGGTPALQRTIAISTGGLAYGYGGTPTVLGPTTGNFRFFINGVERAGYVAPGSFRRRLELNSRGTAEFVTRDPTNTYRPAVDEDVVIYEGTTRVFAGTIESLEEIVHEGSTCNEIRVSCTDYGVLCDRRICARYYPVGGYSTADAMVAHIVLKDLAGTGINYVTGWAPATVLGQMLFNYVTVTEALNRIMEAVGGWWRVDFWGNLRIFPANTGYENAPFSLTEASENWVEMHVIRSRNKYRNRQGIKCNRGLAAIWTDTAGVFPMVSPDGTNRFFVTTYIPSAIPVVKVNDVVQVVCDGITFTEGWQWYYFPNGYGVVQNPAEPVLQVGDTLTVEYPSPLDYVLWAEDAAEIAAHGRYESVEEVQDTGIQNLVTLQLIADGLLARGKVIPVDAQFRTRTSGLEPGQLLSVNTTKPLLLDSLLIEQVESWQAQQEFLWHSVRCSNAPQRIADSSDFFQKLIERSKMQANRTVEIIRFTVAETVEGITNPGLTIGTKLARATAQYAGVMGSVRLIFGTAPTVNAIVIDVMKNDVSVFGTSHLTYPKDGTGIHEQWVFSSNPLAVTAGDVFTYIVDTTDSTAKDGILEIVILR